MEYILSLSYGKDSLACLGAIEQLGFPLDRIVHAEIWATDTVSADLPPMVEFKKKADAIIKDRWGIEVEHYATTSAEGVMGERVTFEQCFYRKMTSGKFAETYKGFPMSKGSWCIKLKLSAMQGANIAQPKVVQYLGIAADEHVRIERHTRSGIKLPLVEIGWDEAYCRQWCEENDLLSPIYTTATRGGCWFCPKQGVEQLRRLRRDYPDLWALLLQWDSDSPVSFHSDGHTVHDFDKRFFAEELDLVPSDKTFRWKKLDVAFANYLDVMLGVE